MSTVETAARDPHPALHGVAIREAAQRALEIRHAQGAQPTFGDAADSALLATLTDLPSRDIAMLAPHLGAAGDAMGRHVYARRCFEDSPAGATAILSTTLLASGWGTLRMGAWFHRAGELTFLPLAPAARIPHAVLGCYLSGVLTGYFSETFNCRADATPLDGLRFELQLHEGRDVNLTRGGP